MPFHYWLKQQLQKTLPGELAQRKMMPIGGTKRFPIPHNSRKSSILLLLYPNTTDYSLIAIKRSLDGGVHSGQIAFPGGKIEPFDISPEQAALREAEEEIHLKPDNISLLGRLSPLYIPVSNFEILPIIGFCTQKPDYIYPSKSEIDKILFFSLGTLLKNKTIKKIPSSIQSHVFLKAPVYQIDNVHFIWGASAMILSELETLWSMYRKNHIK